MGRQLSFIRALESHKVLGVLGEGVGEANKALKALRLGSVGPLRALGPR